MKKCILQATISLLSIHWFPNLYPSFPNFLSWSLFRRARDGSISFCIKTLLHEKCLYLAIPKLIRRLSEWGYDWLLFVYKSFSQISMVSFLSFIIFLLQFDDFLNWDVSLRSFMYLTTGYWRRRLGGRRFRGRLMIV